MILIFLKFGKQIFIGFSVPATYDFTYWTGKGKTPTGGANYYHSKLGDIEQYQWVILTDRTEIYTFQTRSILGANWVA